LPTFGKSIFQLTTTDKTGTANGWSRVDPNIEKWDWKPNTYYKVVHYSITNYSEIAGSSVVGIDTTVAAENICYIKTGFIPTVQCAQLSVTYQKNQYMGGAYEVNPKFKPSTDAFGFVTFVKETTTGSPDVTDGMVIGTGPTAGGWYVLHQGTTTTLGNTGPTITFQEGKTYRMAVVAYNRRGMRTTPSTNNYGWGQWTDDILYNKTFTEGDNIINFTITPKEPERVIGLSYANTTSSRTDLTANTNGGKYVVFMKEINPMLPITKPYPLLSNTTYTPNTHLGDGSNVGGWYCVFKGEDADRTLTKVITNLAPSKTYAAFLIPYTGNEGSESYDPCLSTSAMTMTPAASPFNPASFTITSCGSGLAGVSIAISNGAITTDGNGNASSSLYNGTYNWTATKTGYSTETGTVIMSNTESIVTVNMNPTSNLLIMAVSDNSNAMTGATININNQSVATDANGIALIYLPAAIYTFTVEKTGYNTYTSTTNVVGCINNVASVKLIVEGGSTPTYAANFTVTDCGNPLAGASININGGTVTIDVNGQASTNLPNGTYSWTVSKTDYTSVNGSFTMNTAMGIPLSLSRSSNILTFNITDGTNPVVGASISINSQTLTTDAQGIATITLPVNAYSYSVSKTGFSTNQGSTSVLSCGTSSVVVNLAVAPPSGSYSVAFEISDCSSKLQGATISINGGTLTTDVNGSANSSLPNGTYSYTLKSV